ncbi:MAG: SDR family oxidoreductase [Clostridium sp.]|nr:SDR family oxidoreductase [Clostridium sp.]
MKILLTGGTKGIGLAILKQLISEGHECTIINRSKISSEEKSKITQWIYDLSNPTDVKKVCDKIKNTGEFEVLINNAGAGTPCKYEDLSIEQIDEEINLNLKAPMMIIGAVLPYMKKRGFGRIVNLSSISGKLGTPYLFTYSAAKAGINSLTQSLAGYLRNTGIMVNAICPGGVDTETSVNGRAKISKLLNYNDEDYQNQMINEIGLGRLVKPEEVADMVSYLIRPENGFITGQSINVCGGIEVR